MTTPIADSNSHIDVVLDLRRLKIRVDERHRLNDALRNIWPDIAPDLIGKSIIPGQKIEMINKIGQWSLLVLDPRNVTIVSEDTRFNVVDIERDPEIRHACKECAKGNKTIFGPFYCPECRTRNLPDRLCETHAHFLENKYTAFCLDHVPRCQCHEGCTDSAAFECDYCHKLFSDKWKRFHPGDTLTLLCNNCYSFHFELCADCEREGRKRLGKSRCAFPAGAGNERHGKRICTKKHAWQWQIWGPHWRGIVLCEQHYQQLQLATPADLLWMLVTARIPAPFLRGKVTDVYRLRNIVGYVRHQELSWAEMERVLNNLAEKAAQSNSPKYVSENISQLLGNLKEALGNSVIEENLLQVIRNFYRMHLRSDPASVILGVTIKRVFGNRGKSQTYRIGVRVGRDTRGQSMKNLLIGRGGILVNQLKETLKLYAVDGIDFED